MRLFYIPFVILILVVATRSTINSNTRKKIQPYIQQLLQFNKKEQIKPNVDKRKSDHFNKLKNRATDAIKARDKAKILEHARNHEYNLNKIGEIASSEFKLNVEHGKGYYHMDPVLNQIRRYQQLQNNARRNLASSSVELSSSREFQDWREEFNDYWIQKKFEAVNSTDVHGDTVNMLAARPSGVPCGDPNQHDVPWGSCMLPMECDAEYRIYRGDFFCGDTQYVCCALQISTYDLNQGFDVSFADTSFNTDSEELKNRDGGSKEAKRKKKKRIRQKRQKERRKRKRQMKKTIRRIVHEIRKILNRSYRNSSQHRKRRTKLLKRYIKDLKKQYIKDRKSIREIHREDMIKVDESLKERLNQIRELNKNFVSNATFKDIIIHGSMTRTGARMLVEAYPELTSYIPTQLRRAGGGLADGEINDHLDYDIEYGALYY